MDALKHPASNFLAPEDVIVNGFSIEVPRFEDKLWKATLEVTHKTERKWKRTLVFNLSLEDLKKWQGKIIEAVEAKLAKREEQIVEQRHTIDRMATKLEAAERQSCRPSV
jgi:hypothetical protein